MKNSKNTGNGFGGIVHAFRKYHLTIFIVILVSGLSIAVLMLNEVIKQSSDITGLTSSLDITTFDQQTIDRVEQLRSSTDPIPEFTLPQGRTNPFAE